MYSPVIVRVLDSHPLLLLDKSRTQASNGEALGATSLAGPHSSICCALVRTRLTAWWLETLMRLIPAACLGGLLPTSTTPDDAPQDRAPANAASPAAETPAAIDYS
jgi:hypothetical protein